MLHQFQKTISRQVKEEFSQLALVRHIFNLDMPKLPEKFPEGFFDRN